MKKHQKLKINIQLRLQEIFKKVLEKIFDVDLNPEVVRSKSAQLADYQTPVAMILAKQLKRSCHEVATLIVNAVQDPMIAKLEVAGPGFINIYLADAFLTQNCDAIFALEEKKHEKVLIDYSSPNVAKELHVGHLRSTIIGDSLANLFSFLGYDVHRINHIGDFGTQFGMLLAYITEQKISLQGASLPNLMDWYRLSKTCFDNDPAFKKRSQEMVVRLQAKEPNLESLWIQILEVSRKGFQQIYDALDVKLIERGESFYQPYLQQVVDAFEKKGLVTVSHGAKCIFMEGYKDQNNEPLPLIIQKSDLGFNYATTDLAALRYRIEIEKADRIIYVTDLGQSQHLHMVFDAAKLCGFYDPDKTTIQHAGFGLVLGSDGTKMKTRSGEVFRLIDLIDEAVARALDILKERYQNLLDEATMNHMAKILGINAIKYADLSVVRTKDYAFSFERMLRFEGNTAAFNLYAYVRILSILKKIDQEENPIEITHPTERKLILHLYHLNEVIKSVEKDLLVHKIAEYMYSLAEIFNEFFRDCRVEGSKEQASRVHLLQLTKKAFEVVFEILGLKTLDRM